MKNHVFVAVACLFLAACSDGGETKVAKLEAIPSVSYTHLRAHETGRNLVCRLLLEKKKKKKIK